MSSQSADFVGRERELSAYEAWLTHNEGPWILYVHDAFSEDEKKGGIGKTRLLHKCMQRTHKEHPDVAIVSVDFFNVTDRDGIVIADRIVEAIRRTFPSWSAKAYTSAMRDYKAAKYQDAESSQPPSTLVEALTSDLAELDVSLHDTQRHLVLFFDTFELIKDHPVVALINPAQRFPNDYGFKHIGAVIAGRYEIDWANDNWKEREGEVQDLALQPFDLGDMVKYHNGRCVVRLEEDSTEARALHERTQGRPILVGLVTDLVNDRTIELSDLLRVRPETFEADLVGQVSRLQTAKSWVILLMAHVYHRFNSDIMSWLLHEPRLTEKMPDMPYQGLINDLRDFSFVRPSTTGHDFVLHDEMRRLVVEYCWNRQHDPYGEMRRELSGYMVQYYQQELAGQQEEGARRQSYEVELLYHKLFVDLADGFSYFEDRFAQAYRLWQHSHARSLLEEVQKYNRRLAQGQKYEQYLSQEQEYRLVMLEAKLLMRENKYEHALLSYEYLGTETGQAWMEQYGAAVYFGLAECYEYQGKIEQALEHLALSQQFATALGDRQLQVDIPGVSGGKRLQAEILGMSGYIIQHYGTSSLEDAAANYQQSMVLYREIKDLREYADMLNSLGNIYRLQGKLDEALRCCKVALKLRETLFQQKKLGEVPLGLSLNTIAVVYLYKEDFKQASFYLNEAMRRFQSSSYKKGIAKVYNRQGQIWLFDDPGAALKLFRDAYAIAESVGAQEDQIDALNKQGRALLRLERFDEARDCLERAIELAKAKRDHYQHVESLIDQARVFVRSSVPNVEIYEHLRSARGIALGYHYYGLLSAAEQLEGEILYEQKDYEEAFDKFVQSCHYMALFNALRYNDLIHWLFERLLNIAPSPRLLPILEKMRSYWTEKRLTEAYPELEQVCDEVEVLAL